MVLELFILTFWLVWEPFFSYNAYEVIEIALQLKLTFLFLSSYLKLISEVQITNNHRKWKYKGRKLSKLRVKGWVIFWIFLWRKVLNARYSINHFNHLQLWWCDREYIFYGISSFQTSLILQLISSCPCPLLLLRCRNCWIGKGY